MNKGKICVSLQAPTVSELIERIRSSKPESDLIEIRFDCLEKDELAAEDQDQLKGSMDEILGAVSGVSVITTFRPAEQGGCRPISSLERSNFWNLGFETEIADLEEDLIADSFDWLWQERICSYHNFDRVPEDLEKIFGRLAATGADTVKIAATVTDAAQAIEIWKLLDRGKSAGKKVIPIAMGEAGKWTRILALAHGSPIAYASPSTGDGTAPGQISAKDLSEVFRAKELNPDTKVFGVVAGDTSYSLSPFMHNAAFRAAGLNSVFVPLQVTDLDSFIRRMVRPATHETALAFGGLSVTNPHKQSIVALLDDIDPTAKAIGAVNTVKVDDEKLIGFNTDAPGFIAPLRRELGDLAGARVAVAGAGGAARAVVYALKEGGAEVTLLVRDLSKASSMADEFDISVDRFPAGDTSIAADILVNATPLGTRGPDANRTIAMADQLRDVKLVYDLVYNPGETRLLHEARIAGARTLGGLDMLIAQGVKQFEIWTGREAPAQVMRAAIEKRLQ